MMYNYDVLCYFRCFIEDHLTYISFPDSVGQSDTANTAEIVYSAWRGGECLRSCGLGSIELLYAAPSFSYLPASNQRVIEDRMIL